MRIKRGKLVTGIACIDYHDDDGRWIARVWEQYPGAWSVKLTNAVFAACYKTEYEAITALSSWIDISTDYIPD